MNGTCNGTLLFDPAHWGHGEGSKGQISLNFNNQVNFRDFLYQTLCVFLQIKSIKHFEWDFCSDARVGIWGHWVPRGSNLFIFFNMGHMEYQIYGDDG